MKLAKKPSIPKPEPSNLRQVEDYVSQRLKLIYKTCPDLTSLPTPYCESGELFIKGKLMNEAGLTEWDAFNKQHEGCVQKKKQENIDLKIIVSRQAAALLKAQKYDPYIAYIGEIFILQKGISQQNQIIAKIQNEIFWEEQTKLEQIKRNNGEGDDYKRTLLSTSMAKTRRKMDVINLDISLLEMQIQSIQNQIDAYNENTFTEGDILSSQLPSMMSARKRAEELAKRQKGEGPIEDIINEKFGALNKEDEEDEEQKQLEEKGIELAKGFKKMHIEIHNIFDSLFKKPLH